jgi:2-polyprenyl-3-methyl-5-hydroxy-6-metoxy-1,4-benzoquinol methylase
MPEESQRNEIGSAYAARVAAEQSTFRDCVDVHNLPEIFHYWSNRFVRPKLEELGISAPNDLFRKYVAELCGRGTRESTRLVSIGSGNCDLEISLASQVRSAGQTDFVIDCLEMNSAMLDRGRAAAEQSGLSSHINFVPTDLNEWTPGHEYDGVIANQILHHVVKLEDLFANIKQCLKPEGLLIISDMIGRNGHQRWPEALDMIQEFWRKLPPSYRFNRTLQRYEELFEDWDCSVEGFEGIRSEDILPLLLENFHFKLFFGFANLIDPFVDRAFGHNFDAQASWDRNFIDEVNRKDEQRMAAGRIQPTHMLAVLSNDPAQSMIYREPLTPQFCLRRGTLPPAGIALNGSKSAYEWHSWPHSSQRELEIATERLTKFQQAARDQEKEVKTRTEWALQLEKELEERTAWALRIDKEMAERTTWALQLEKELAESTAGQIQLNNELERVNAEMQRLQREVDERNSQVAQFGGELERLEWARPLDRRLHKPLHFAYRIVRWMRGRGKQE